MDNKALMELLEALPEAELDILKITQDITLPDGSIDLAAAANLPGEIDDAYAQARTYMAATKALNQELQWKFKPRPGYQF